MILFYLAGLWVIALVGCLIVDLKREELVKPKNSPTFWVGLCGAAGVILVGLLVYLNTTAIPESKYLLSEDQKMTLQNLQLQVLPQTGDTNVFHLAVQTPNGFEYLNQQINSVTFEGDTIILEKIVKRVNWGFFNFGFRTFSYTLILPIRTVKAW